MNARTAVATSALVVLLVGSCELLTIDVISSPGGLADRPFFVELSSIEPDSVDVPSNQVIELTFSQYLDPDSFEYFNALLVSSGSIGVRGFARYRLADRTLTFFPTLPMRHDLIYTVTVNPDTVRSLAGEPLTVPFSLDFQVASAERDEPVAQSDRLLSPRSFQADVAPILAAGCSCHGDERAASDPDDLIGLGYNDLVDVRSRQWPDRYLVRPFDPAHSYLVHKVLPEYPDRRFSEMPPPWAVEAPLTPEELSILEAWIAAGADP
jgi:hypothetical protein